MFLNTRCHKMHASANLPVIAPFVHLVQLFYRRRPRREWEGHRGLAGLRRLDRKTVEWDQLRRNQANSGQTRRIFWNRSKPSSPHESSMTQWQHSNLLASKHGQIEQKTAHPVEANSYTPPRQLPEGRGRVCRSARVILGRPHGARREGDQVQMHRAWVWPMSTIRQTASCSAKISIVFRRNQPRIQPKSVKKSSAISTCS